MAYLAKNANVYMQQINVSKLIVRSNGRRASQHTKDKIFANFDSTKAIPRVYPNDDGTYTVFDGITVVETTKERNLASSLNCIVYDVTPDEAYELYLDQGDESRNTSAYENFRHRCALGDPISNAVDAAVTGLGTNKNGTPVFKVSQYSSKNRFGCVRTLEELEKDGKLDRVLGIISKLDAVKGRCSGQAVKMVAKCIEDNSKMRDDILVKVINKRGLGNCVVLDTSEAIVKLDNDYRAEVEKDYNNDEYIKKINEFWG